jgi:xylulokinase
MSYLGIDVGTSSVKACVYREDGDLLASERQSVHVDRETAGREELHADVVWSACQTALLRLSASQEVERDPVSALAISASGDEVFPVDAAGEALYPCILSGDARGEAIAKNVSRSLPENEWLSTCGHIPQHFDPVCRILWINENEPDVSAKTAKWVNWHDFLTHRLTGRAVTDRSLASKWAIYDFTTLNWSTSLSRQLDIDPEALPEILPWRAVIDTMQDKVAQSLGLNKKVRVCMGGFDASVSALGAGAVTPGIANLTCGTWQNVVAPIKTRSVSVGGMTDLFTVPHPDGDEFALVAQDPNGAIVASWAADLLNIEIDRLFYLADGFKNGPGSVNAVTRLSGAASRAEGATAKLSGITLASTPQDIVQALLEGVAYQLAGNVGQLRQRGVPLEVFRATGGSARSKYWTQLKADLTGIAIEIPTVPEPGAFGAALLAMACDDRPASDLARELVRVGQCYEPNFDRAALYAERLSRYARS